MSRSHDSPLRPVQIAVAVVENEGQFLIGLRPEGVPLAGLWEFPGGKLEPGESAENAAIRECLEETGLMVRVAGEYPPASHSDERGTVRLRFFACAPAASQPELPARFRWVKSADLNRYSFPPANAELLNQLSRKNDS
ncbi:MAG TPA: (deoxy)nucleoside triphosphate pyrophosphohydrolase [Pirellulales bacterium]|jgi:mutator protein MutT|nr:(deoxy)nucleoside triphosphate pyrophosphohydrolase [Pirellulales bacterium]